MFVNSYRDRLFDYVPRLDPRNKDHRVTISADPSQLLTQPRWWTGGTVLDQGREGACVGFGCVQEALGSPIRVRFPGRDLNQLASEYYHRCKEIDEWEGVDYDGTSVRAGMLVGRERKHWTGFKWSFNMVEFRQQLENGPIVIGIEWTEEMYDTLPNGDVKTGGQVVGGHCLLVNGYSPNYNGRGPRYRWRNSWTKRYGVNGNGYIEPARLEERVYGAGGEAAVVEGRHL